MKFLLRMVMLFVILIAVAIWFVSSGSLSGSGILQGLGLAAIIIAGIILLVVAGFGFKIYRLVKKAMAEGGGGMAARIQLVATDEEGAHPNESAATLAHLEAQGFRRAGRYRVDALQGLIVDALVKPEEELAAAIYDHPGFNVFYDVTAVDAEGNSFSITTSPLSHPDNVPPGSHMTIMPGLAVQDAVKRMRAERPEGNWQPLEQDNIVPAIENAYARSMDFQISRGTITPAYVRQIAAVSNPKQALTEELIQHTITQHEAGLKALIQEACIANFLKESGMPAAEWERTRDQVIVIHDRMQTAEIKDIIDPYMPDGKEAKMPREPLPPQEMFLKYLEKYRLLAKFKYLGSVESPVPARLFRAPD